jgi:hypothetical protein
MSARDVDPTSNAIGMTLLFFLIASDNAGFGVWDDNITPIN